MPDTVSTSEQIFKITGLSEISKASESIRELAKAQEELIKSSSRTGNSNKFESTFSRIIANRDRLVHTYSELDKAQLKIIQSGESYQQSIKEAEVAIKAENKAVAENIRLRLQAEADRKRGTTQELAILTQIRQSAEKDAAGARKQELADLQKSITLRLEQSVITEKTAREVIKSAIATSRSSGEQLVVTQQVAAAAKVLGVNVSTVEKSYKQTVAGAKRLAAEQKKLNNLAGNFLASWRFISRVIIGSLIARGLSKVSSSFGTASESALEFQKSISEIQTISQRQQLSLEQWSSSIRGIATEFNRTQADVAEAAYQALSDQVVEGAETFSFLEESARLSIIAVSSMEAATKSLTAIINSYKLEADDARDISDKLFKAVDLGRFRLEDIASTIGNVTVPASQLGLSLEDTLASLAVLTRQGVTTSTAMTGLRNVILKLIKPTERMKELIRSWGENTAQGAIETFGFLGVIERLQEAAASGESELQELGEILNRLRAIVGGAGLTGNIDQISEALTNLSNASKEANEGEELVIGTPAFKLEKQLNELSITLSKIASNINAKVTIAITTLTDKFGSLSDILLTIASGFVNLSQAVTAFLVVFAGIKLVASAAPILAFTNSLIAGSSIVTLFSSKTKILSSAFLLLKNNIALISAAIIALGVVIVKNIIDKFNEARLSIQRFTEESRAAINELALEAEKAENEVFKSRLKNFKSMTDGMTKEYRRSIADQQASLNKIKSIEEQRAKFQDALFDLRSDTGDDSVKKELFLNKLIETREELLSRIAKGDIDSASELINKIRGLQSEFNSLSETAIRTKGTIDRLFGGGGAISGPAGTQGQTISQSFTISQREIDQAVSGRKKVSAADKLVLQTIKELEKAYDDFNKKFPKVSQNQIETAQNNIDSQRNQVKALEGSIKSQVELLNQVDKSNEAIELSNKEIATQVENIVKGVEAVRNTGTLIAAEFNAIDQGIDLPVKLSEFINSLSTLRDTINESITTENFQITPDFIAKLAEASASLQTAYQNIQQVLPIVDIEDSFRAIEAQLNVLRGTIRVRAESQQVANAAEKTIGTIKTDIDVLKRLHNELGLTAQASITTINESAKVSQQLFDNTETRLGTVLLKIQEAIRALKQLNAESAATPIPTVPQGSWTGRYAAKRFASGGSVGSDNILANLSAGEFVLNKRASRQLLPQLVAANSNATNFNSGGEVINNNIGDINVTLTGSGVSEPDARNLANAIRRELKRGTIRL